MDITLILAGIGGPLLGAGAVLAAQWYQKWHASQNEITQGFVEALVEAAEKLYEGKGRGKEKLAWVFGVLHSEAERLNITFNEKAVTDIVDAYVEKVFNSDGVGEAEVR